MEIKWFVCLFLLQIRRLKPDTRKTSAGAGLFPEHPVQADLESEAKEILGIMERAIYNCFQCSLEVGQFILHQEFSYVFCFTNCTMFFFFPFLSFPFLSFPFLSFLSLSLSLPPSFFLFPFFTFKNFCNYCGVM